MPRSEPAQEEDEIARARRLAKEAMSDEDSPAAASAPVAPKPQAASTETPKLEPGKKVGNFTRFMEKFAERFFEMPPGQIPASARVAKGKKGDKPGPLPMQEALDYSLPGLPSGKVPTYEDLEELAKNDANFRPVWERLKDSLKASQELAQRVHGKPGDQVDWNLVQGRYVRSRAEEEAALGLLPSDQPEPGKPSMSITIPGERKLNRTESVLRLGAEQPTQANVQQDALGDRLAAFVGEASDGLPGSTRPPLTKEEIASAAWDMLRGVESAEVDKIPYLAQRIADGAAIGVQTAPMLLIPEGAAVAEGGSAFFQAIRPALQGAAMNIGTQGLAVLSGQQKEIQTDQLLAQAALFKAAEAVGRTVGEALNTGPVFKGAATLGTMQAINDMQRLAAQGGITQETRERPIRSTLGWIAENAAMMGTAGAMGSLRSIGGKDQPQQRGITSPEEYRNARTTMDALYTGIRSALGKLGVKQAPSDQVGGINPKVQKEFFDVGMRLEKTYANVNDFLDQHSGGNPVRRAALEDLLWQEVEGKGEFSPAPALRDLVTPEQRAEGVAKMQAFGEAGLAAGERMREHGVLPEARFRPKDADENTPDTVVMKRDFDEGRYSREVAAAGGYGDLVGGYAYHEGRGHFLPHITDKPGTKKAIAGAGGKYRKGEPGYLTPFVQEHLLAREQTAGEALSNRVLKKSPTDAMELFREEIQSAMNKARYDELRDMGLLRRNVPTTPEREAALSQADTLSQDIRTKRSQYKTATPEQRRQLSDEINASIRLRAELLTFGKDNGFTKLSGSRFGEYDGWYIHKDAKRVADQRFGDKRPWEEFASQLTSFIKSNEVGLNPALVLTDKIGNMKMYGDAGINTLPKQMEAMKIVASRRLGKGKASTPISDEFFVLSKSAQLGGPTDIVESDTARARQLRKEVAKAKDAGESTFWLRGAQAIEAVQAARDKVPGVKQLAGGRRALVDESDALAGYMVLREKGVNGSGPMTPHEAFEYLRGVSDYSSLPNGVQSAAVGASYLRWRAKVLQNLGTRALLNNPSVLGVKIPTPMDAMINAAPGSKMAQAALVARGLTRMGLSGAQWIAPMFGAQAAMLEATGIKKKELDAFIDHKYSNLPAAARWIIKQTELPLYKTDSGRIVSVSASSTIPEMAVLRYFWLAPKPGESIVSAVMNKNVLAPFVQGAMRQDYRGLRPDSRPGEKWLPGGQWWPSVSALTPSAISGPISALGRERKDLAEGSTWRAHLRSILGVPLNVMDMPNEFQSAIDDGLRKGSFGLEERSDGSSNLYVYPGHEMDVLKAGRSEITAKKLLASKWFKTPYGMEQEKLRRIQRQLESAGQR